MQGLQREGRYWGKEVERQTVSVEMGKLRLFGNRAVDFLFVSWSASGMTKRCIIQSCSTPNETGYLNSTILHHEGAYGNDKK